MVHLTEKKALILLDTSIRKKHKQIGRIVSDACYVDGELFPAILGVGMYSEILRYPFDIIIISVNGKDYRTTRTLFKNKSRRVQVTKNKIFNVLPISEFGMQKAYDYDKQIKKIKQENLFDVCDRDRQRSNRKHRLDI